MRSIPNSGIFSQPKLTIKSKSKSEALTADLKRKNSKKLVSSSVNFDQSFFISPLFKRNFISFYKERTSKTNNFSYDSSSNKKNFFGATEPKSNFEHISNSEPRKSKNEIRLPKIDSIHDKEK